MAEQLFSFGVYTAEVLRALEAGQLKVSDSLSMMKEVDVHAHDRKHAEVLARQEAHDLYGDGCDVFPLPEGGYRGLMIFH